MTVAECKNRNPMQLRSMIYMRDLSMSDVFNFDKLPYFSKTWFWAKHPERPCWLLWHIAWLSFASDECAPEHGGLI